MISKQHKLTTKEVNYLLRRRQAVYAGGYKILYCDQYPNNPYHQTGIQVSGKIHKHAVQRNIIRRAYYAAREDLIDKAVHNRYHKIFVMIHPEHCEEINQITENGRRLKESKKDGNHNNDQKKPISIHQQFKSHFSSIIISALGKINNLPSKTSGTKPRPSGNKSPIHQNSQ